MSDIEELDMDSDAFRSLEAAHPMELLMDAIEKAAAETDDAEDGKMTWLIRNGQRIAAIIPRTTAEEIEYQFMDPPPHNEDHHRYHSPASPMEGCPNCKFIGWLSS